MTTPEPTPDSYEEPTRVRWLVFWLACGTSWFLYVHRYAWNIVRSELKDEFAFNNTQIDSLTSLFYGSYTIFQVPSGMISDAFGPHLFLGAVILLWAIVLPLLGLTGRLPALGSIMFLFGTGQAGGYPALGNVTRTWFPATVRTRMQGWVASFFGRTGGAMSTILMSTVLMGWLGLGWRASLVVLSAAGVLFAIAFLILFRNSPEQDSRVNDSERRLIQAGESLTATSRRSLPFGAALRNRSLRILVFQQFCNAGADVVYTVHTVSYFKSQGISNAMIGLFASLPLWGGAIGGMSAGYLNDWLIHWTGSRRWGRATIGFAGKVLATAFLYVAITRSAPYAIAVWLFIVKFFSDWTQPTVWGTCTDLGGRYSGTVFSINNTSGNLGAMVLPFLVIGPLLDHYTVNTIVDGQTVPVTNYTPVFVLMGVLYMVSAICWFWIDCTKRIEADTVAP